LLHPVRFALLAHSSYRAPIPNAPPIFALDAQTEEPTEGLPDPCRRDRHLAIQQLFLAKKRRLSSRSEKFSNRLRQPRLHKHSHPSASVGQAQFCPNRWELAAARTAFLKAAFFGRRPLVCEKAPPWQVDGLLALRRNKWQTLPVFGGRLCFGTESHNLNVNLLALSLGTALNFSHAEKSTTAWRVPKSGAKRKKGLRRRPKIQHACAQRRFLNTVIAKSNSVTIKRKRHPQFTCSSLVILTMRRRAPCSYEITNFPDATPIPAKRHRHEPTEV